MSAAGSSAVESAKIAIAHELRGLVRFLLVTGPAGKALAGSRGTALISPRRR
jgi:hypothetical protein